MTTSYLSSPTTLPSGVIVKLGVVPMPEPDVDGRCESRYNYSVNAGLFRGRKLVGLRPIGTVICDESEVEFADDSRLGEADIETLDLEDQDRLLDLGVVLTELVLQISR